MTVMQWLYAVAIAMVLAALLQLLGTRFAKLVKRHSPETKIVVIARFIAFFIFFLYSAARAMAPGLDRHIPPAAFVFGWVIVGGVALHLLSEPRAARSPQPALKQNHRPSAKGGKLTSDRYDLSNFQGDVEHGLVGAMVIAQTI